jgi:hypothetical protein
MRSKAILTERQIIQLVQEYFSFLIDELGYELFEFKINKSYCWYQWYYYNENKKLCVDIYYKYADPDVDLKGSQLLNIMHITMLVYYLPFLNSKEDLSKWIEDSRNIKEYNWREHEFDFNDYIDREVLKKEKRWDFLRKYKGKTQEERLRKLLSRFVSLVKEHAWDIISGKKWMPYNEWFKEFWYKQY